MDYFQKEQEIKLINSYYHLNLVLFQWQKKTGAKVLPVAVTGDYEFRSKNLTVRFGKPFDVENMTVAAANEKLYNEIAALMNMNLNNAQNRKKTG